MSNSNRFKDNEDGTVTDTQSNLTWIREDGWQKEGRWFSWDEAKEWAGDVSYIKFGNSQEWRLPDEEEILTLYDTDTINKDKYGKEIHLDAIFPSGPQATVWLKSEQGHEGTLFDFKNGETRRLYKSKSGRMSVRLVYGSIPRS
jgi:hypothetical protein